MNFEVSLTAVQAWIFLPAVLPLCLWACYTDITEFKIKNVTVLALLAAFVIFGPFAFEFQDYAWRYAHVAVVLVAGFILSVVAGIGAGDAKFAAAMAPFIALADVSVFLVIWCMVTLATVVVYAIPRFVPAVASIGFRRATKMPFPFGIALAPALVIYLVLGITQGGA